jgi:hypothetical protein
LTSSNPWGGFRDDLEAVAPSTGPFPHAPFLIAAEKAIDSSDELLIGSHGDGSVALVVEGTEFRFAGHESVTDYHAPLGQGAIPALVGAFERLGGHNFSLDSMPEGSLEAVSTALDAVGAMYSTRTHGATGVLALPDTAEDWLMSLGKKERHEVRRKRRRYEAEYGEITLAQSGTEALDVFRDLHRSAPGEKGAFMTDRMLTYFGSLLDGAGATMHNLIRDGRTVASAFGFETEAAYYYYNSAYDHDIAHASPGIVLLSTLIDLQIQRGAALFDFLKGAEAYKYRHGARARELYVVEGRLP